jgi:hypothetical protein
LPDVNRQAGRMRFKDRLKKQNAYSVVKNSYFIKESIVELKLLI